MAIALKELGNDEKLWIEIKANRGAFIFFVFVEIMAIVATATITYFIIDWYLAFLDKQAVELGMTTGWFWFFALGGSALLAVFFIGLAVVAEWFMFNAVAMALKYHQLGFAIMVVSFFANVFVVYDILKGTFAVENYQDILYFVGALGIFILFFEVFYTKSKSKYTTLYISFISPFLVVQGIGTMQYKIDAVGGSQKIVASKMAVFETKDKKYKNYQSNMILKKGELARLEAEKSKDLANLNTTKAQLLKSRDSYVSYSDTQLEKSAKGRANNKTFAKKTIASIDAKIVKIDAKIDAKSKRYETRIALAKKDYDGAFNKFDNYDTAKKKEFYQDATDYRQFVKYASYIIELFVLFVTLIYLGYLFIFAKRGATKDIAGENAEFRERYANAISNANDEIDHCSGGSCAIEEDEPKKKVEPEPTPKVQAKKESPTPTPKKPSPKTPPKEIDYDRMYKSIKHLSNMEGDYMDGYLLKLSNETLARVSAFSLEEIKKGVNYMLKNKEEFNMELVKKGKNNIIFLDMPE